MKSQSKENGENIAIVNINRKCVFFYFHFKIWMTVNAYILFLYYYLLLVCVDNYVLLQLQKKKLRYRGILLKILNLKCGKNMF